MIEQKENRFGLSGFQLKLIALILMVIDHIGEFFAPLGTPVLLRWLGRLSAPIFCLMIAEGYRHTRSVKRYFLRIYIGFVIMGLGNFLLETFLPRSDAFPIANNIFGLFALAVFYMAAWDRLVVGLKEKSPARLLSAAGMGLIPIALNAALTLIQNEAVLRAAFIILPLRVEGGTAFLIFTIMLHVLRERKVFLSAFVLVFSLGAFPFGQPLSFALFSEFQWMMVFSLPLMLAYNGRRGFAKQDFFYLFYPLHIWGLYIASRFLI